MTKDYLSLQNVVIDFLDDDRHILRSVFQNNRDRQAIFDEKVREDYKKLNHTDIEIAPYRRFYRTSVPARQFYGAIQPLADMWKDAVVFSPYKSDEHTLNDLYRPIVGVKNTLTGAFILAMIPVVLTVGLISNLRYIARGPIPYLKQNMRTLGYALSWVLDGASHIIRGVTETAAWPLLLIRSPFRCATRYPSIESHPGYQEALAEINSENTAKEISPKRFAALYEIHRKKCKNAGIVSWQTPFDSLQKVTDQKSLETSLKSRVGRVL